VRASVRVCKTQEPSSAARGHETKVNTCGKLLFSEEEPHHRPSLRSSNRTDKGSSPSAHIGTRKMVNYARGGRSQGKLWWKSVSILTCKSFVTPEYRGERPIEPSSSWFPPNFPSGLLRLVDSCAR